MTTDTDERFFNRDLSWLEFDARVLSEAFFPSLPLLERVKFLSIFSANLDEFFMVRVAGLKRLLQEDIVGSDSPDRMQAADVLARIRARTTDLIAKQYEALANEILPELKKNGIEIVRPKDLSTEERKSLKAFYNDQVFPILTPLAVDPAHPFPFLSNNAIYLMAVFDSENAKIEYETMLGLVEVPDVVPRLIPIDMKGDAPRFVLIEDLIIDKISHLFLDFKVTDVCPIRVTRNLDYNLLESEVTDLLRSVKKEMIRREQQEAVRLEMSGELPRHAMDKLLAAVELDEQFIYRIPGPLDLSEFMVLTKLNFPELKDPPFNPRLPRQMSSNEDIFSLIAKDDILVHHPYESFYAVVEFLRAAADDAAVVAIKQTLYRTSGDSPIIEALIRAAENGKQVTAVIELKARFDEKNNIEWANRLERAGIAVVYGFIGLKTHCKATLVVRREQSQLVRYTHLSTGNYNSSTARVYTDIGLFTCDNEIGRDVSNLFNLLTGFNVLSGESRLAGRKTLPEFGKLAIAPVTLRQRFLEEIDQEMALHAKHGDGLIIAKMNALVDTEIIEKLYQASQAGVKIRLIVRGICCLRPGIPGLSENIQVTSVIDRFLEHSRIYYFHANGEKKIYLASADWMTRNMDRRIEVLFPIEKKAIRKRLINEILAFTLEDNVKAWRLKPDGSYVRLYDPKNPVQLRSQERFIEAARAEGIKSLPYDLALRHNPKRKEHARPVSKKGQRKR